MVSLVSHDQLGVTARTLEDLDQSGCDHLDNLTPFIRMKTQSDTLDPTVADNRAGG
jgi:hypothetical protein